MNDLMQTINKFVSTYFPGEQAASMSIDFVSGRKSFVSTVPVGIPAAPRPQPEPVRERRTKGKRSEVSRLRRSILAVFESTARRHTLGELAMALTRGEVSYSERHIQRAISSLGGEVVNNKKDSHGRGYGLVEWPGEEDEK